MPQMQSRRVAGPDDPVFPELTAIYETSFCADERREMDRALFANPRYALNGFFATDVLLGFAATWRLDGYLMVEHLAIAPQWRGRGFGGQFLRELIARSRHATLILEVERPANDQARRRIAFYERWGFQLNPYPYLQPAYAKDKAPVPLFLMSYGRLFDLAEYRVVVEQLYRLVYHGQKQGDDHVELPQW